MMKTAEQISPATDLLHSTLVPTSVEGSVVSGFSYPPPVSRTATESGLWSQDTVRFSDESDGTQTDLMARVLTFETMARNRIVLSPNELAFVGWLKGVVAGQYPEARRNRFRSPFILAASSSPEAAVANADTNQVADNRSKLPGRNTIRFLLSRLRNPNLAS